MIVPCKDCTRRRVGCHNVNTCEDWRAHVETEKKRREKQARDRDANGVEARRAYIIDKQKQEGHKHHE